MQAFFRWEAWRRPALEAFGQILLAKFGLKFEIRITAYQSDIGKMLEAAFHFAMGLNL